MDKVHLIKAGLSPIIYFKHALNGSLGKSTGKDWHMWNGICPFHADKKAGSFCINKQSGAFKCFSCGTHGGDIIAFHQQNNSLSFGDTINQLWKMISCN
tara:strand:- start:13480 stop:13776 length:297 start_codon:yes stop_codon:yes gene_type:complete